MTILALGARIVPRAFLSMEHPLINNIDHLTLEELQDKINDLTKKLAWAHRSGNANLRMQVQLALDTFTEKYRQKQQALYDEKMKKAPDWSGKIDIS